MARRRPIYDYDPFVPERCEASGDKIIFRNAADARKAAERAFLEYRAEVSPYQDPTCGHWHLTSKAQW